MTDKPAQRFYPSPVDYIAWSKGYMPPSEHILIDALAHRGARVISSAALGETHYWFVVQGKRPSRKALHAIQMALLNMMDDGLTEAEAAAVDLPLSSGSPPVSPSAASAATSVADEQKDSPPSPSAEGPGS